MREEINRLLDGRHPAMGIVSGVCVMTGILAIVVGIWVGVRSILHDVVPIAVPAAAISVGALLLLTTREMWHYHRWARNLTMGIVVCLGWVIAEAASRKLGGTVWVRLPVVVYAMFALAYFLSAHGRHAFEKAAQERADARAEERASKGG